MRLSEQELNLIESSLKFVKADIERCLEVSSTSPPVIDSKYQDENGDTVYEAVYKNVLEQSNAMLKRIGEIR